MPGRMNKISLILAVAYLTMTIEGSLVVADNARKMAGNLPKARQNQRLAIPYVQPGPIYYQPYPQVYPRRRRPSAVRRPRVLARESSSSGFGGVIALLFSLVLSSIRTTTTFATITSTPSTTIAATSTTSTTTTQSTTTTPMPCTVAWSTWTTCDFDGARYRNRECPDGMEAEHGVCSIDCLQWSEWSTCATPIVVDEKQTRSRLCATGYENEEQACHSSTTVGHTSDGWYRASNGYEYKYISSSSNFDAAVIACETSDPSSTLASVGARSSTVLDSGISGANMGIPAGQIYFVGATDAITENNWLFLDGVILASASLTNWGQISPTEPNGGTNENCLVWLHTGGSVQTVGIGDAGCDGPYPAMCERKAT